MKKKFHKLRPTKKNFTNLDPRRIESIGRRQAVKWSGGIRIWRLCRVLIRSLGALGGSELREDWEREREREAQVEGNRSGRREESWQCGLRHGLSENQKRKGKEACWHGLRRGLRENLKRKGKEAMSRVRKRETGRGHACERKKF